MKLIGIDANVLTRDKWTGTERYVFELLQELKKLPLNEYERIRLYTSKHIPELGELPKGWEMKEVYWPLSRGWTHGGLGAELLHNPPDVFFSPAHEIPFLQRAKKIVATVHDVAFRRLVDVYDQKNNLRQEWAMQQVKKRATAIIAVSQATAEDLQELYQIPQQKITVIHHGVEKKKIVADATTLANMNIEAGDFFLFIGRIEKKKNIATLVRAFAAWKKKTHSNKKLVLAGTFGFGAEEIRECIVKSECKEEIILPGFISEEEKYTLLTNAHAYVLPSFYEGFGMPVLEAMAAGAPVIASEIAVMKEVCADAAIYADPHQEVAWIKAFDRVEEKAVREQLIAKGSERVKQFTWKETAKKTLDVLRNV